MQPEKEPAANSGSESRLAWKLVLSSVLGLQHFALTFRQPAPLRKEEAVRKGEVKKCARAVHLDLPRLKRGANYRESLR
jgi:hypothetical protein